MRAVSANSGAPASHPPETVTEQFREPRKIHLLLQQTFSVLLAYKNRKPKLLKAHRTWQGAIPEGRNKGMYLGVAATSAKLKFPFYGKSNLTDNTIQECAEEHQKTSFSAT